MTTNEYLSVVLSSFRSVPALTEREERALVRRWQRSRDGSARDRLVEANMRHVASTVRRLASRSVSLEDLLSEGCLGLLVAIEKFDADKGVRLSTYARYWIRAYALRAVVKEWKRGKTGLGRVSWTSMFRARRARDALAVRYGEEGVSLDDMARDLGMSAGRIEEAMSHPEVRDLSIDCRIVEDEGPGHDLHERLAADVAGPEAEAFLGEARARLSDSVERVLSVMTERERIVIMGRLMDAEPQTLQALGARLGVSRERVRQIEMQARQKLVAGLERDGLASASLW